jgi:hypothetical protein
MPINKEARGVLYPARRTPALLVSILPYVDHGALGPNRTSRYAFPPVSLYLSPADPTSAEAVAHGLGLSSYAANAVAFRDQPRLNTTFVDGTSNTIALAEHYAHKCGGQSFYYWYNLPSNSRKRRASFSDVGDITPPAGGWGGVVASNGDLPTFQTAPARRACNPSVAQTPHNSGMLVALADGSIRALAPHISPRTYWSAVTPNGGEPLGADW